jgi:hypothetical protein
MCSKRYIKVILSPIFGVVMWWLLNQSNILVFLYIFYRFCQLNILFYSVWKIGNGSLLRFQRLWPNLWEIALEWK